MDYFQNTTKVVDTNDSLLVLPKQLSYQTWGFKVAGAFLLLVAVFGFLFNITVLLIYVTTKHIRTPPNTFIVAIAVADVQMAVFALPLAAYHGLVGYRTTSGVLCTIEGWFVYCFGLSSLYLLMAVSIERYLMIARPIQARFITNRIAAAAAATCFGFGFFWSVMPLFGWSSYAEELCMFSCGLDWTEKSLTNKTYIICIFIFCFVAPGGVMFYCYCRVYTKVKSISRNNVWDMNSRVARRNLRIEKKMLKSIVLMCACFLICWTPYAIMAFWQSFGDAEEIPIVLTAIPAVMAKSELVWNPLIYVATNKQFRKAFYARIPCRRLREKLIRREEAHSSQDSYINDTRTGMKTEMSRSAAVFTIQMTSRNPNAVSPNNSGMPTADS